MSHQTALAEAIALPADERLDLVMEIWDSLAADPERVATTSLQKDELDHRRRAYDADPTNTVAWEDAAEALESEL